MSILIMMMMILTASIFLFIKHPLTFGFMLMIQTIFISLLTGMMNFNYWFSYILFLIMIGGMLVLFMYMTSIASNEMFKFSQKIMNWILSYSMIMLLIFLLNDNLMTEIFMNNSELMKWKSNFLMNNSMNKYLNWPSNLNIYMIIIYLFITLILVVKITNVKYGPLRQKF
uniref:NADH-ubiquinone oxidoreductase chain 6 n=1 Tax=Zeugophora sp. BMNH 840207 TaxID=904173 RepID=I7FDB8_9CUCU|nr:NADH dehydrogenase subunit 6 [Zeugophora sp. BMNH 840207]